MSNQKTGFEIRADLLGQAQGILENNRHAIMDAYHTKVQRHLDAKDVPWPELPEGYTRSISPQEVIDVARQLNSFVNEK
jgi:hypothetical protein